MNYRNHLSLDKCENINQIIDDLYNKAGDLNDVFTNFFCALRSIISYDKANIFFYRSKNDRFEIDSFLPIDWEASILQRYLDFYYQVDDILPMLSSKSRVMSRCTDVFETKERKKTKFYKELIKPAGIDYSIDGNIYVEETGEDLYYGGIGIFRSSDKRNFSVEDLQVMKWFQPHLIKVVQNQLLARKKNDFANWLNILDHSNHIAIGILDGNLNLIFSNNKFNEYGLALATANQNEILERLRFLCKKVAESSNTHLESRIELCEASYFVEISMTDYFDYNFKNLRNQFIALVYDVPNILSINLLQLKDQNNLSQREYEVVQLVLKGFNNKEISEKLYISLPTVKKHLSGAYDKLGLKGRNQLLDIIL